MIKVPLLLLGLLLGMLNLSLAQTSQRLNLQIGPGHLRLLDLQAAPVTYRGLGPHLRLGYERKQARGEWQYQLRYGLMAIQAADKDIRQSRGFGFGAHNLALQAGYNYRLVEGASWAFSAGVGLRQELLLDFGSVGAFPWIFGQGNVLLQAKYDYQRGPHQLSAGAAVPIFSWITDMPYHQIPRLEGRAPDVYTVFAVGTRVPSWSSYQRVDLNLNYAYELNEAWSLSAHYQWSWYRDEQPDDLWAYQGILSLGFNRRW
ncbi:MAG: hypothetical protein AAFP02_03815 [Bacteroidota bacterium]